MLLALGGVGLAAPVAQAVSGGTAVGWGYDFDGQTTAPAALDDKSVTAIDAGYHRAVTRRYDAPLPND